jgi:hypothetical protein
LPYQPTTQPTGQLVFSRDGNARDWHVEGDMTPTAISDSDPGGDIGSPGLHDLASPRDLGSPVAAASSTSSPVRSSPQAVSFRIMLSETG